jgi:hypothetical protein
VKVVSRKLRDDLGDFPTLPSELLNLIKIAKTGGEMPKSMPAK